MWLVCLDPPSCGSKSRSSCMDAFGYSSERKPAISSTLRNVGGAFLDQTCEVHDSRHANPNEGHKSCHTKSIHQDYIFQLLGKGLTLKPRSWHHPADSDSPYYPFIWTIHHLVFRYPSWCAQCCWLRFQSPTMLAAPPERNNGSEGHGSPWVKWREELHLQRW